MLTILQYLWAGPNTGLGLFLALLCKCSGGHVHLHTGVVEAAGGILPRLLRLAPAGGGGASAMTLGHVVIAINTDTLDRTRVHERVHVRQYERWGPLFIPAYFLASAIAAHRGHNAYFDNPFEVEAYRVSDGRMVRPTENGD